MAWFHSKTAAPEWKSVVNPGTYVGTPTGGQVTVEEQAGNGATRAVKYLSGNNSSNYSFGRVIHSQFTICSLSRYTGNSKQRILQGSQSDWLHGHYNGNVGVARYGRWGEYGWDGWKTSNTSNFGSEDWLIMCCSNTDSTNPQKNVALVDGVEERVIDTNVGGVGKQDLVINQGFVGEEASDWGVAEVITWSRYLDKTEMQEVVDYMKTSLLGSTGEMPQPSHSFLARH